MLGITKEEDSEHVLTANQVSEQIAADIGASSLTTAQAKSTATQLESILSVSWLGTRNTDEEAFINIMRNLSNADVQKVYYAHGLRTYGSDFIFFNTAQSLDLIEAIQSSDAFNPEELTFLLGLFSSAGIKSGDARRLKK